MKIPPEWNIIPLKENSKYPPIIKEWQTQRYPRDKLKGHKGNYALGTGMISGGLIVFDWDFRRGNNRKEEGIEVVFNEFKEKLRYLANTCIVETPHGYHFYYILKDDKIGNTSKKNVAYDKKKFIPQNSTRFGKYLAGLDTRANGGYVVCPPSKVNEKEYRWVREVEPLEITLKEYEEIFKFFEIPKKDLGKNTIRQGFVDILEGKINPNEIKVKGENEHVLWKEVFHECYAVGLLPGDLLEGLQQFQKGFDLEKTKEQLNNKKNIDYILNGKRLSAEKYSIYFNHSVSKVQKDLFQNTTPLLVINYDNADEIHVLENMIIYQYAYKKSVRVDKILDCSFKIIKKCFHQKEERFTYLLNGQMFYTDTIMDILRRAEPYLRKGLRGRDVLKEVISHYSRQLKNTTPREFLGFDNEWILPQTEEEKDVSIIVITDYQQEAYNNALHILENYSDKDKELVKKDLKRFLYITQCEAINLGILSGWSVAAPFRLYFIQEHDLFPILYNYGPPNTGRSTLEDFWIIDFYGIYTSHLPPNTSIPRLEDHLSKSTFPYSLQDIKESNINRDLISMLQDYSTSIGLFERKKGSKEIEFIKFKIAGLNLDSNEILEMFSSPAINERQIFTQYKQKTQLDLRWVALRKKLKKYKLFSFIYDYTKDWTNEDLDELYLPILERFNKNFETNSSRLLKSGSIIRFGIDLFSEVFDIKLSITDEDIMNAIMEGSTTMTSYIVDQFREFCLMASAFEESYEYIKSYADGSTYDSFHKGDNPHYINHKLRLDADNKYYAYTSNNHEDYKRRFNERSGMKSFVEKIQKGLSNEEASLIEYTLARPFLANGVKCKPMGIIKIYPEFLNDTKKEEIEGKNLVIDIDEVLGSYGAPPNE